MADGYNAPMHMEQWERSGMSWQVLGGRLLTSAAKPKAARAINTAAVIVVAGVLAHWTWSVFTPPQALQAPGVIRASAARPRLAVLLSHHLFGRSKVTRLAGIPVSHLALTLSGLVAGTPGVALIATPGAGVRPYVVGTHIAPGVVLAAVTRGRAILRQNGRLESLLLYPAKAAVGPAPGPGAPPPPVAQPPATGPAVPPTATITIAPSVVSAFGGVSTAELRSWLVPGPEGGVLVKQAPAQPFASLGLKRGDIIEEINGRPVNSLGSAISAYVAGAKSGGVTVDVARGGHMKVLRYRLQGP